MFVRQSWRDEWGWARGGRRGIRQRDIDAPLMVKYEGSCSSLVLAELRNDCLCDNCVTFVLCLARRQHICV